jgi:dethiobiotin synthetase
MNYFITAIGTNSGKTIASAILTEHLKADYWKPIQCGEPGDTDSVRSLISNKKSRLFPERYFLNTPASPHAAAKVEGISITLEDFQAPQTDNQLIIEGAGGIMVPLNETNVIGDLIPRFNAEVILVSNLYLGSINHTLLSIDYIKHHGYPVKGLIFNGVSNPESEDIILKKSGWPCLLRIDHESRMDPIVIFKYVDQLAEEWK